MDPQPPVAYVTAETKEEARWRRLEQFMESTKEQLEDLKKAVDLLLAAKELDDD